MKRLLIRMSWVAITVLLLFAITAIPAVQQGIKSLDPTSWIGHAAKTVLTIGLDGVAYAMAPDYFVDGIDDNVQVQQAINGLPTTGGKIILFGGNYSFSATVSRAIDNVTFEGSGKSTYLANNASTPLISAGSRTGWVFRDIRTDAGWFTLASDTIVDGCWNVGTLTYNGLATLDSASKVPTINLGGSGASGSTYLRGDQTWADPPGGGTPPAWKGNIVAAYGDGTPWQMLQCMQTSGVISPTPTNITITVARVSYFKLDTAITVNKIRWYGVGATTGIYHVAVYRDSDNARLAILDDFNTAAAAWGSGAFSVTLAADTLYFLAVSVDTTGTTAGVLAMGPTQAATTGMMILPTDWPGNLDINAASPKIAPAGFAQFAVTAGVLPATAPARVNQAAWTGGMPAFFLDNNNN